MDCQLIDVYTPHHHLLCTIYNINWCETEIPCIQSPTCTSDRRHSLRRLNYYYYYYS